jgi:LemA protein
MQNKKKWIIIGGIIFLVLVMGSSCVGKYNRLVTLEEGVTAAWAQVENVLQRRGDLIPNLVNTVKGIAKQEKDVFIGVAEARSKVSGAKTVNEKVKANQALDGALSRLMLVVERYPELKSNQNFLALQDELSGSENRLSVERRRYNESVRQYNVVVKRFPTNIMAGIFGFEKKEAYFEAEEGAKAVPQVEFVN